MNITLTPGKVQTKAALAKLMDLHSSEFYAICGDDDELDEVRICFDVYQVPGQEYLISCPPSTDRKQCKFPIVVK